MRSRIGTVDNDLGKGRGAGLAGHRKRPDGARAESQAARTELKTANLTSSRSPAEFHDAGRHARTLGGDRGETAVIGVRQRDAAPAQAQPDRTRAEPGAR